MELFHFDIETAAEYRDFTTFESNDSRGAKLFQSKFKKMEWDKKYNDVNHAYVENGGIISTYGRIVCISFGFIDDNGEKKISSYFGEDEKYIVESFNNLLKKIERKNFNLSGFRIHHFDIPWVLHKLHKYGIKPTDIISPYGKKPWEMRVTDMADDWKGKFAWSPTFDEMCYELGVDSPKANMNGSEVHVKFWEGEYEQIKKYCEMDVSSSIDVSKLLY